MTLRDDKDDENDFAHKEPGWKRTYVVCLDCGKKFTYNWEQLRIEGVENALQAPVIHHHAPLIHSATRQLMAWASRLRDIQIASGKS